MELSPRSRLLPYLLVLAAGLLCQPTSSPAQGAAPVASAPASISGRVSNATSGQFLNNARLTVHGTNLVAFTDESGTYHLDQVPAGSVVIEVFYTGLEPQSVPLTLTPAAVVERDIALVAPSRPRAAGEVVKLGSFVVSDTREMDGAAIAINEQRFAPNIVSVVSADEFGLVPDGNIGEFLKLLPGITMSYRGSDPREVSIDGVSSENVPVSVGGFSLATPEVSGVGRNVELNSVSINNMSRVEAVFSPTPESPGSALAGTINLVPRSAFERSRPVLTGSTYLIMRANARDFHKTPGPLTERTRKVQPGFEFTWIVPVSKAFGFTLSGGASAQYTDEPIMTNTWRGANAATNGGTLPDTTPDRPYLSDYLFRDTTASRDRTSLGLTLDYRLTPIDRLSFSFQYGTFHSYYNQRNMTFIVNRVLPGDFSPRFTHGFAGSGEVRQSTNPRDRLSRTVMPSVTFRHEGPIWKVESGFGLSQATNEFRDIDKGYLQNALVRRTGVTISFDDIFYLRPGRITVQDGATGAPIDPYQLSNYAVSTAGSSLGRSVSRHRTAFGNVRRDFGGRWPLSVKAGFDLRQSMSDYRTHNRNLTYLGADGRSSTTPVNSDDSAGRFLDRDISTRTAPYGFPQVQWMNNASLWDFYRAQPNHFTTDANAEYRSLITNSKHSEELISALYLRGDLRLFGPRLRLTGGVRAEQTNIKAEGPLTDPTLNYRRDASGRVMLGSNGRPLTIASDALTISQLTYIDRGKKAEKEYLRLLPSVNGAYQIRENLLARAAWYQSLGRPSFNQYSGALTLPDLESPPSNTNRITVNNVGIKAWQARSTKLSLEYYFERVGQLSVGAFRRDFKDFFSSTVIDATPAFLGLYGLDPAQYDLYEVATQGNISSRVRMEGYNVNYRQVLTFLPHWARGVQFYANGSAQRATGVSAAEFAGYFPKSGSWGISLSRPKFNTRLNWNYLSRQRRGALSGRSIEPGSYNWGSKRSYIDLSGEYSITRRFALFGNLRNFNKPVEDVEATGPNTPEHAQLRSRADFGSLWTCGVKGSF